MEDQNPVPPEVTAMNRSMEERQMRAMCVDFATRILNADTARNVIPAARDIYKFITGEEA